MTTTSQFQELPDFYTQKPSRSPSKPKCTNDRYSTFTQVHFTAGDIDQFETYRDPTNGEQPNKVVTIDDTNIWNDLEVGEQLDYEKYSQLTTQSVMNTFLYLFEKFKKGIFVKIKDNKLVVFLPFSKNNYVNEWGNRMKYDPSSFRDMTSFLQYASKLQCYDVQSKNINAFPSKWYANNCLVRSEYPVGENDRCVSNLKDMLETLCREREIPDIELFFNRRDFPLIKRNNTEPYEHIFDDENYPLQSHRYDKYCPILSMVTTDINADIAFPTMEDWARVSSQSDNKFFSPDFKDYKYNFNLNWDSKIPTAVFRGASTGCGVTIETNPRLKLARMSGDPRSPVEAGHKLLDAGITKWNCRPRKLYKNEFLQVIDPTKLGIQLASFLDPVQQSNYKYVINVDGHVSAFRLSLELSMGSVILLQKSKYRVWFRKYLVENVHYVSINEDLSDLYDKIRWCRQNDEKCREIAKNAKQFYETYLTKKATLDFAQKLFCEIKNKTGTYFYNYISVKDLLYQRQLSQLEIKLDKKVVPFYYPIYDEYDYKINLGIMNGVQLFLKNNTFSPDIKKQLIKKQFTSKDTIIDFILIKDHLKLSIKKSTRKYGVINEAFTGLNCVNFLLQEIPNFKYTYGISEDSQSQSQILYTEYVEGETFSNFIKTCTLLDFIGILQQLFLTLAVAQEKFGFVHNDLSTWNVIIKILPFPTTIVYSFKDQIINVETTCIPVIIDYDKSHFIHKNIHYGIISPFMTSTVQDCFCILVHACYEFITEQDLSEQEKDILLYIINFLSNTEFHPVKIENIKDAKEFLSNVKKYNEMVYRNKCDLESLQPFDFFNYIETARNKREKDLTELTKKYKELAFLRVNKMQLDKKLVQQMVKQKENRKLVQQMAQQQVERKLVQEIAQQQVDITNLNRNLQNLEKEIKDLENQKVKPANFTDINGQKVVKECNYINPMFFYDMIIGQSFHDNLISYIDNIEEQVKYKIDQQYSDKIVHYVYAMNQFERILQNILLFIHVYDTKDQNNFIQKRNCNRILYEISTKISIKEVERLTPICGHFNEKHVGGVKDNIFCTVCDKIVPKKEQSILLSIGKIQTYFVLAKYTPETFSIRGSILTILQENDKLWNEKYITVWYMLRELILYKYKFSLPYEKEFQQTYGKLLNDISPLAILNHNANYHTVREISKEIYKIDKEKMKRLNILPTRVLQQIDHILTWN